jgi:23S rRNA (cytidine1920-2'-O)/16S rRNA (cytidine1409-2'-O)-methyltransferase
VSRAGQKLYGAIEEYDSVAKAISGAVCVDIGASTGGFTDCLLQHGAEKVYAVDVGQSLLDWKIRSDSRVVVVEKCNARYLNSTLIPRDERFDMVVCDVSFISLKKVLPPSLALCKDGAHLCCLIKPQFECAKEDIGTGGIVRDTEVRERCVDDVLSWFAQSYPQWSIRGTSRSCITGTDGNVEYILVAQLTNKQDSEVDSMMVSDVISES